MRDTSLLACPRMAPLAAGPPAVPRRAVGVTPARLGRLAASLAALALPVIGIAAADTVHRATPATTRRPAASPSPSDDAAVPDRAARTATVREARLQPSDRAMRR